MSVNFKNYYNKISNCSGDERGKIKDGQAGDQTKNEWKIRDWYNRPWNCILRYPDQQVRQLIAQLSIEAANNDMVGYDQNQRDSYWKELQKVDYRPAKIKTPCQTDCSAGVIANTKAAGALKDISKLKNIDASYTGNMKAGFKKAGFTVLTDKKYLTNSDYLLPGDILLYENHHTATNLGIGSKIKYTPLNNEQKEVEVIKKEKASTSKKVTEIPLNTTGKYNKESKAIGKVTANFLNVRKGPGANYKNLISYPTIKKNTKVDICDAVKIKNGDVWYYIYLDGDKGKKFGFVNSEYIKII